MKSLRRIGNSDRFFCFLQMGERAKKEFLFGEHGERGGAGGFECRRQNARHILLANDSERRRGLFQLGDDVESARASGPRQKSRGGSAF